jgi:hypothetical protein
MIAGGLAANSVRTWGGSETRGISDATAPGLRDEFSGVNIAKAVPAAMATNFFWSNAI